MCPKASFAIYIILIFIDLGGGKPQEQSGYDQHKSIKELIGEVDNVEKELLEVSYNVDIVENQGIKRSNSIGKGNKRRNRVRVKRPVQQDCQIEFEDVCIETTEHVCESVKDENCIDIQEQKCETLNEHSCIEVEDAKCINVNKQALFH